jgi:hypothetical protein
LKFMRLVKLTISLLFVLVNVHVYAQYVQPMGYKDYSFWDQANIGNNGAKLTHPSAYLELGKSNLSKKGLLLPRGNKDSVVNPAPGLIFYNIPDSSIYWFNAIAWKKISIGGGGGGGGGGLSYSDFTNGTGLNYDGAGAFGLNLTYTDARYQAALSGSGIVKSAGGTISYLTDNSSNWNTAFGWGNHSSAGYELQSNKTTSTTLNGGSSNNTRFPTELAVKTYVDNAISGISSIWYNVKDYGAVGDGTTDDRSAIQSAINAANAAGGGIVYFPNGIYNLGAGINTTSRAQLTLPLNAYGTPSANVSIKFLGESGSVFNLNPLETADRPNNNSGVILKSQIPAGQTGVVVGSLGVGGIWTTMNFCDFSMENITVRLKSTNGSLDVGVKDTAISMYNNAFMALTNVKVDNESLTDSLATPAITSAGIVCPSSNNWTKAILRDINVTGVYKGIIVFEHSDIKSGFVDACYYGLVSPGTTHPIHADRFGIYRTKYGIKLEGSDVYGISIDQLDLERNPSTGRWFDWVADLDEATPGFAYGNIKYAAVHGTTNYFGRTNPAGSRIFDQCLIGNGYRWTTANRPQNADTATNGLNITNGHWEFKSVGTSDNTFKIMPYIGQTMNWYTANGSKWGLGGNPNADSYLMNIYDSTGGSSNLLSLYSASGGVVRQNTGNNTGQISNQFQKAGTTVYQYGMNFNSDATPDFYIYDQVNGAAKFYTPNNTGDVFVGGNAYTGTGLTILNSGQLGIGNTSPHASAALDITSTTKGFLAPRMNTAQQNAITPATGLMIFNTDTAAIRVYTGAAWVTLGATSTGGGSSTPPGGISGQVQYNNGGTFGGFGNWNGGANRLELASDLYFTGGLRNINFGTGFGGSAITLYDGGATGRYGWGLNSSEMQFFVPTAGHISFNKGGDFQSSGTNEVFRIDDATGLLLPASKYLNFGTTAGSTGYGFRDNSGTMQFKNSGGSWADFGSGGGTPGGANTQVQYNNSSAFAGAANLTIVGGVPTLTNINQGLQLVTTSASTTTLTVSSPFETIFTGSSNHAVVLPNATTLAVGHRFRITDQSTGNVTIRNNGASDLAIVTNGYAYEVYLTNNSTSNGSWQLLSFNPQLSLTTTGTSGAASYNVATGVLNIPNYAGGMTNPMTTVNDIIIGGSSGTPTRLGVGGEGQALTVSGGNVSWASGTPWNGSYANSSSGDLGGSTFGNTNTTFNVHTGGAGATTLPLVSGGYTKVLHFVNEGTGTLTISRQGTDQIFYRGANVTSVPLAVGESKAIGLLNGKWVVWFDGYNSDYLTPSATQTLTNKDLTSGTNTFPTLNQNTTGSAATLTTTRTIWGQNFNGSANVTGDITLGANNITMTGSIGATGARATKVWATDAEFTNMITINGTSLSSATSTLTNKTIASATNNVEGTLLNVRVFSSGTTYTPTSGTTKALIVMIGAGGGGGGVTGTASSVGAAGGGGAGGYCVKFITGVTGTYTYAIGTAGTAGANTGANGGNGGNTTFTNGATTYIAFGGSGGVGQTAGTAAAFVLGGAGAVVSTNGDINAGGSPGLLAYRVSGTLGYSGTGGDTEYGGAGIGLTSAAAGNAATGYGAGGGGALSTANTARAGGAGAPGLIIIYEYK